MVADPDFTKLSLCLSSFKVTSKPAYEKELEEKLTQHLRVRGYNVERQTRSNSGRTDIRVHVLTKTFIIELKRLADRSCVTQLDRYARTIDGLFLLCWQASKAMQTIFQIQKQYAKIPIELVEVKTNCDFT